MMAGTALTMLAAVGLQLVIAPPTPPPLPLPDESSLTLGEAQRRMTVPVTIGPRGPWNFIIDTGAERTVVSRELAGVLGLSAGPTVRVTAMTGTSSVDTVIVPGLSVSTISRSTIEAPALEWRNLGAQGMLGVDALQGHVVAIDFDRNRMTLKPSRRRRMSAVASPDDIVITAKSLYGQLIVTDARCGSAKIAAIVDTGSALSVGNVSFLKSVKRPRLLGKTMMISVTGKMLDVDVYAVDNIMIGGIRFDGVPIAIADGPPFARFGLGATPALLLGMDALRLFRTVQVDFANREIRFTLPRGNHQTDTKVLGL